MTLLGRLFGAKAPPPPPPNSVVIDSALVSELTAGGEPLDRAVDAVLRAHLASLHEPKPETPQPERVPFWLERGDEHDAIDDELRDRIIHRRETETDRN